MKASKGPSIKDVPVRAEGVCLVRTFCGQGVNFSRFCADVFLCFLRYQYER